MPAREPGSSYDAPNGVHAVGASLLKRHKTLPHPREPRVPEIYSSTPVSKPKDLSIDTGTSSLPSSDTSSPRTLKHASRRIGAPGLPPTPPNHSRQSSGSHPTITSAPRFEITHIQPLIGSPRTPNTPPNQRSPPTPDVTPPRTRSMAYRPPLSSRPTAGERLPSSRTDSFKTARENPYSSDEDEVSTVRPVLRSKQGSAAEIARVSAKPERRKEIGLGLGLESDNEGSSIPKAPVDSSQEEFVVFDGEWGSTEDTSEVEREWDDNLMRNVTVRKRPARNFYMPTHGASDEVIEDDIVSPTIATKVVRGLPLQERIARHRLAMNLADRTPTEKIPEQTAHSLASSESPLTQDARRFSNMSGKSFTSTVVEAMVVEAPFARRQTLRHTKKVSGLRDKSSDHSTTRSSTVSVTSSAPLHHPTPRLVGRKVESLASNTTVITTSSTAISHREVMRNGAIPVVVIPERRSSTKSSKEPSLRSTSSRKTRRSMSLNSGPLSQSSKYNDPGHFENFPTRKRTMSESGGSSHSVRTIDFPPTIPARRSSLSAPTSRNTSRAGSLTAESLNTHNLIQAKTQELLKPAPLVSWPSTETERDASSARLNVDHNGDPFFGNRLSTQVTPFSQASYETAGTMAEVSEALAVSIFPHQNTSVLVVQQRAPSDPPSNPSLHNTEPTKKHPKMAVNGKATDGPLTPPQPMHPMDEVDSPLRNPRSPPQPPAIKFIPPTPAGDEERQLGYDLDDTPVISDDKPKRSLSLVRRAFSNRRNSESSTQSPGFLKRTFSLSGRRDLTDRATQTPKGSANPTTLYPSVVDRPADGSKLHPFWRPAHFWDDLEDQEALDGDEFDRYFPVASRPSPPKRSLSGRLKRTFAIVPVKDDYEYRPFASDRRTVRRTSSGNMRVVKQRSNNTLRRGLSVETRPTVGPETFGYGFKEGNGGRVHTIPGLGLRVEYLGWSGMRRKMSERKREQRNEILRQSISGPRGVKSGVDDVLRRKATA